MTTARNRLAAVALAVLCLCFLPAVSAFACDGCEHSCGETITRSQVGRVSDQAADPAPPHAGRVATIRAGTSFVLPSASTGHATHLSTPLRV